MPQLHLIQRSIPSPTLGTPRTAWVEPGAAGAPLCIFLDGELYLKMPGIHTIVSKARKLGLLTNHRCVFVSFGTMAERHAHYACNPRYSRFLVKELIPAISGTRKIPVDAVSRPRFSHLLIGLSLSGLAAVFAATRYPNIFPRTIAQSPSAWWKGEWLAKHTGKRPMSESRFWVSVGSKETDTEVSHAPRLHQEASQLDSCRSLAAALRERHAKVRFSIFDGGHEMKCWKRELPDALRWVEGR